MRKISAHYIVPVSSPPLKNGIIFLDDRGVITGLIDTGGKLRETGKLEFYDGIITPGFVLPWFQPDPPLEKNDAEGFRRLDSWLQRNGVAGVGLVQPGGTHFREKQQSSLAYHTLIEICPEEETVFSSFQGAVETMTHAWNHANQVCSVIACPRSWCTTGLPAYLLEFITTHQALLTLRHDRNYPLEDQALIMRQSWNRLYEAAPAASVPGKLMIIGHAADPDIFEKPQSGEPEPKVRVGISGLETSGFAAFPDLREQGSSKLFIRVLYALQETLKETASYDLLKKFTLDAARALFEEETLGSLEPGKAPGLNLISKAMVSGGGRIRLQGNSCLKVL